MPRLVSDNLSLLSIKHLLYSSTARADISWTSRPLSSHVQPLLSLLSVHWICVVALWGSVFFCVCWFCQSTSLDGIVTATLVIALTDVTIFIAVVLIFSCGTSKLTVWRSPFVNGHHRSAPLCWAWCVSTGYDCIRVIALSGSIPFRVGTSASFSSSTCLEVYHRTFHCSCFDFLLLALSNSRLGVHLLSRIVSLCACCACHTCVHESCCFTDWSPEESVCILSCSL